ncbi:hypothetical protein DL98DRAFT_192850 [Cadophora sp. DSE1049]|nr:hypothetical protein DL98DRAFT_192850 [Cadophora sp. DSE1049]
MTHLNQTDGLEDPFTGPQPASARSSRSTTVRARGQQNMSALSQTLSSRLNSAKSRSSSVQDHKAAFGSSPLHPHPTAITPVQQIGISTASNLIATFGARPAAPSRSVSANTMPSSRTAINDARVAPRRSTSGIPLSSILTSNNGAQRSLSGPSKASSHPALRSNVRKGSITANQAVLVGAAQPVVRPSMSTSAIAHAPSSPRTSQRDLGSAAPTSMLIQPHISSPVATVPAVHQLQQLPTGQVPYLKRFTVFPQLPTELQQEIWSIAIAVQYHKEKRFLRVAPDPKSLDRTDDDAEVSQLRIISDIHRRPRLVPSLLHVCQYTRREAIKGYELWGCADPITYEKNDAKVYVKVDIDTFFFGDADLGDFWVFHTFIKESEPENASADDTARGNFIEQIGLIKHFTIDYELWIQSMFPRIFPSIQIST